MEWEEGKVGDEVEERILGCLNKRLEAFKGLWIVSYAHRNSVEVWSGEMWSHLEFYVLAMAWGKD